MPGTQRMGTIFLSKIELKENYIILIYIFTCLSNVTPCFFKNGRACLKCRTKTNSSEAKHDPDITDVFISKSQLIREHIF